MPMTTAPTTARTAIVEYWRRMNATAPSKIVPGDVLHRLGARVAAEDVASEVEREEDRRSIRRAG